MERPSETPAERIERLVAEGKMPREAVRAAEVLWYERLRHGVLMPNGEYAAISLDDLYHVIIDRRIWRKLWRIAYILAGVFEIRTAEQERRIGFSRWQEEGRMLVAYVILEADSHVWTMHVIDEKRLRKLLRQGDVLWKR